jgi:hypothetical protein
VSPADLPPEGQLAGLKWAILAAVILLILFGASMALWAWLFSGLGG